MKLSQEKEKFIHDLDVREFYMLSNTLENLKLNNSDLFLVDYITDIQFLFSYCNERLYKKMLDRFDENNIFC